MSSLKVVHYSHFKMKIRYKNMYVIRNIQDDVIHNNIQEDRKTSSKTSLTS